MKIQQKQQGFAALLFLRLSGGRQKGHNQHLKIKKPRIRDGI